MSVTDNIDRLLAEAAEQIKKEAYAAGWRDAIAAITKAATDLAGPSDIDVSEIQEAPEASEEIVGKRSKVSGVTIGSTPYYVVQAISKRPGMSGPQVVAAVQDGGHPASEASIRTSMDRLRRRKIIVTRHRKWFPL